jgi:hypothetical protein
MKNAIAAIALFLAAASASAGMTNLVDYKGNGLPTNPSVINDAKGNPDFIFTQSKLFKLYAFGTGPQPLASFNGLKRECLKLDANHTGCYSTNPFETDLVEDAICGYPAVPAIVMACRGSSCVSEIYVQACSTSFPDTTNTGATYVAPIGGNPNFAGTINENGDFGTQDFSTRLDFTGNLNAANLMVRQGRTPILGLGALFMNNDGSLKADAREVFKRAVARFPTVFNNPDLIVEIADEPFLRTTTAEARNLQVDGILKSSAMIREFFPKVRIGVTIAPTWDTEPFLLPTVDRIMPAMNWIATDPYLLAFSEVSAVVLKAFQFNTYIRTKFPGIPTWLIVQGFAPVFEKPPAQWGQAEINTYAWFLSGIQNASKSYDGVLIWGWNAVNELQDEYSGENFPKVIKDMYIAASNDKGVMKTGLISGNRSLGASK